jgi:hypothetical protein
MEDPTKLIHTEKFSLISDYFNFDENDIDLHKLKKGFQTFARELKITKQNFKDLDGLFDDLVIFFQKSDLNQFQFPYLKSGLSSYIDAIFHKFNNMSHNHYMFLHILSNKNKFALRIHQFYLGIIKSNYFGISPKFAGVITREVKLSEEYNNFTDKLADWYTKIEMIIFLTSLLNQFFHINFMFDEKKYSLETNFDFSIKTFAKKNLFKLASYVFRKVSFDISMGPVNYNKIFFLLISSLTCGISVNDLFVADLRQLAFVVI